MEGLLLFKTKEMNHIVLSLGSNQGDRLELLRKAIEFLSENISDIITSNIYETKAVGMEKGHENDFLNMVCSGKTNLRPDELLSFILGVEKKLGRERMMSENYLARTIDLDILFYNDEFIQNENLIIPHPRIIERDFVLKPLSDILPDFKITGTNLTVKEALSLCDNNNLKIIGSDE